MYIKYMENKFFPDLPFFYTFIKDSHDNMVIHCHEFYEIFLTLSDNFVHIFEDCEECLPQGTLVFVRPDDNHANQTIRQFQSYLQLGYTQSIADTLFNYLGADYDISMLFDSKRPPKFTLSSNDFNALLRSFKKIESIDISDKITLSKYYKNLLFHIFTNYFCKYASSPTQETDAPSWLTNALKRTRQDKLFIDGIDAMINASGKSYQHFARALKQFYGKTPSEYILNLRLSYAFNLITTTNFSITDISYLSGFNNSSYFYKSFTKKYEKTPLQIRKDAPVAILNV